MTSSSEIMHSARARLGPVREWLGVVGRQNLGRVVLRGAFVHVVKSVQHRTRSDNACRRTHLQLRGLQSKRPMRTLLVVIPDEFGQHGPKMLLVKDDDVVDRTRVRRPGQERGSARSQRR
jgi:hypothetical protein